MLRSNHITEPDVVALEASASASPKKKFRNDGRTNIALKQQTQGKDDGQKKFSKRAFLGDVDEDHEPGTVRSQEASPRPAELEAVRATDGPQRKVHRR